MFSCCRFQNILNSFNENRLAHAFLIETNDFDKCYKDLILLIKQLNCPNKFNDKCADDCNLCYLIDTNSLPSLIEIEPDGTVIKKDQILSMMERFNSKPIFSKFNIYLIKNAESFNSSSANTLLKFLEEPTDDILGFFITNNKMNVISTVRSRCQEVTALYDIDVTSVDIENINKFVNYLDDVYKNDLDLLVNRSFVKTFKERYEWVKFFVDVFYYLNTIIEGKDDTYDILKKISKDNLLKVILKIEDVLKYIKSNGNIDLILDKFVIEMREYYE